MDSEAELQMWTAKGKAAFLADPEKPLGAVMAEAGINPRHPFYTAFLHGWEAELKAHQADLTPRGRTRFAQHRAKADSAYRRQLKELVK